MIAFFLLKWVGVLTFGANVPGPQNGYLEIFTDLCEEQLQELRMTYNIDITEEDIEACLDDAENL